jgi:hypothetical protein
LNKLLVTVASERLSPVIPTADSISTIRTLSVLVVIAGCLITSSFGHPVAAPNVDCSEELIFALVAAVSTQDPMEFSITSESCQAEIFTLIHMIDLALLKGDSNGTRSSLLDTFYESTLLMEKKVKTLMPGQATTALDIRLGSIKLRLDQLRALEPAQAASATPGDKGDGKGDGGRGRVAGKIPPCLCAAPLCPPSPLPRPHKASH